MIKEFDLNIESILEDWEVHHALREIISNALDEMILSCTKDIDIFRDDMNYLHIRDYGRGLKYEHLTQNENIEKIKHPNIIGKFGVGLKDALATLYRHGIRFKIYSKFDDFIIDMKQKILFDSIITLHAIISKPSYPDMDGTEYVFYNVDSIEENKAKNLFLRFSDNNVIDKTPYGEIIDKFNDKSYIYINGVKVAEEENFLFSYNITSIDKKIKTAINRERNNIGRSAYTERVKLILLDSKNENIASILANDLKNFKSGMMHDELKWVNIQEHAIKILSSVGSNIFTSAEDIVNQPESIDSAKNKGYEIITIPEKLKEKIYGEKDIKGNYIRDINVFHKEEIDNIEYNFIDEEDLSIAEKAIYSTKDFIFKLIGGKPDIIKDIKISETMLKDSLYDTRSPVGLWLTEKRIIIIKRSQLKKLEDFAGTLLHEVIHAKTGCLDVSRDFELHLTHHIGILINYIQEIKNKYS